MNLDASRFLEDVSGRYARIYEAALSDMFVAAVTGNRAMGLDAFNAFSKAQSETMAVAEVLGAQLVLRGAAGVITKYFERGNRELLAFTTQTIMPRVELTEAIEDMLSRVPVTLRRAAERTAERIAQLYSSGRAVAFARSAEAVVTHEAREFIARAMREGIPEGDAGRKLSMAVEAIRTRSGPWTENYSRMVFRTNVNTAVTAGRFRQVQDPDVREVIPAFRFDAVGDSDTRPNHKAADGVILRVDNAKWNSLAPPLGYNCRCQVSLVSLPDLEAMRRVDRFGNVRETHVPYNAAPDVGFRHGGRPDLFLVG
jgi:SPP1 gp7 family putative phage head morphogenesis protein